MCRRQRRKKPRASQICSFSIRFQCVWIYFTFTLWKGWTSKCRWIDIQRCCLMLAYTCESKIPFFIFACNRRGGCVNVPQGNDSEFKLVYRRCLIANVRQAAIELSWFQKETFSSNAQKLWNEMTASVTSGMVVSLQWGYFCFLSLTFKGKLTQ